MEGTQHKSNWVLVISGGRKYLGDAVASELGNSYITLNPCFEYYSDPIQVQTPQGRVEMVGRTKIVAPFDHTLGPAQVSVQISAICYFKDMQPEDRKSYEAMVEDTCRNIEAQRVKRNTGIVIAQDIPNGGLHAPGRT